MNASDQPSLPSPVAQLVGKTLKGQYAVEKLLGFGGMGAVFKGRHLKLDRPVAIKVLFIQLQNLTNPEDFETRFRREARLASQLSHPNIAQVYDFDVESGMPYMVMEYVAGVDLIEVIEKEKPIPPRRALAILRALGEALAEAASKRVVHRDIKPGNIRLQDYAPDGPLRLKVLDFGIAKQVDADEKIPLTQQGTFVGTPSYVAPEQISPEAVQMIGRNGKPADQPAPPLDERADLYSAGVIFYEMLTGQRPFRGSQFEVINCHLFQPPPELPSVLPAGVRNLCMRLLAKRPPDRVSSAAEMLAIIDRLLTETGAAAGRSRWIVVPAGLALLGLAGLVRWLSSSPVPEPQRDLTVVDLAQPADLSAPRDLTPPRDLLPSPDLLRPLKPANPVKPPGHPSPKSPVSKQKPNPVQPEPPAKPEPPTVETPIYTTPEGIPITPLGKKP